MFTVAKAWTQLHRQTHTEALLSLHVIIHSTIHSAHAFPYGLVNAIVNTSMYEAYLEGAVPHRWAISQAL